MMNAIITLNCLYSFNKPQKLSTKDVQCHNPKSEAPEIFMRKSEKISPLLSTPRSLCKNKGSSCKVWGRERLQSCHTQAGKKKFLLWKNMMRTLENRNRSSVSARPQLQREPHLLTERRESALKQFDSREVITFPPHFSPIFSLFPSLSRTQTKLWAWLYSALLWIPISRTKHEILLL